MFILEKLFRTINHMFPARVAYAHCDVPCGIYDPNLAQIAALTTIRMNQLIQDLPKSGRSDQEESKFARCVAAKEEHAEVCKRELRILWGDYFKPEHVQKYPDLHELFWNGMKLGSKVRQEINMGAAQELLTTVQSIADIFWKTKGANSTRQASLQTGGGELVYPVPNG